jgi:outer membrane murein-binding lipoprotein Lpp
VTVVVKTPPEAHVRWNKFKSLFVETPAGAADDHVMTTDDLSGLDPELAKYLVPDEGSASAPPPLPAETQPIELTGDIDFQALYDHAGIPNTDEVESLERFLSGLDDSLPQSSKLAAAKAFLGAIGKSPDHVLVDAERKIKVVRAVEASKRAEVDASVQTLQARIDELQRQIDEQRSAMETARKDLESVRQQCITEEARLQGSRIFFGAVDGLRAGR